MISLSHKPIEGGFGDFHPNNILRLAISVAKATILDCFVVKSPKSNGIPKIATVLGVTVPSEPQVYQTRSRIF